MALGACEQKKTQPSSAAPPPAPLAETVSTQALPPAPPAAPVPPIELADPFELLDRAKAKPPAPPKNFDDVQKDAVRRARELRAESDRVREIL
jgi:hypothetical protein